MTGKTVRIGGAIGYWGESPLATPQFLAAGCVDYIVYDYLAEITLSIMARARAGNPELGYATDFVSTVVQPNLQAIADQRVRLIANAGGMNPAACARRVREIAAQSGHELQVAVVKGDDLLDRGSVFADAGVVDMFAATPLPPAERIASINAYLGAFPIARALAAGADIVITGRCVDSALALGACIHEFGWQSGDLDLLAAGSLAGHLLECGPQATGGNHTDWDRLPGPLDDIGYPVAEVSADGAMVITKPAGTAGAVTVGTVAEQLLYEIGDPQRYLLPDVVCDFSGVTISQAGEHRVAVTGARGSAAPDSYKVSLTAQDGFRGGTLLTFYGFDAEQKATAYGKAAIRRARKGMAAKQLADFSETSIEIIGADSQFGDRQHGEAPREVAMKIAARHPEAAGIGELLKALAGLGLAAPPGLSGFAGARPKPTPLLRLYSFLLDKRQVEISIDYGDRVEAFEDEPGGQHDPRSVQRPEPPAAAPAGEQALVPLVALALGRSGDKGNNANIGIIARDARYLPYIWAALDEQTVAQRFAPFLGAADGSRVERFLLPGCSAINFLLHDVLGGGGVASIRNDPQGKGYAQILLEAPVAVPLQIAREVL